MDATLKKYLGKTLRAARLSKGLSQAQVAQVAHLASGVYGRIERGGMMPSVPTMQRLCRALDVEANTLLGFSSPSPPAWLVPSPAGERPAVHQILRTARRLGPRQLRALRGIARAMLQVGAGVSKYSSRQGASD